MPTPHALPQSVIDALATGLMSLIVHAVDHQKCSDGGLDLSPEIVLSVPSGQHNLAAEKGNEPHG